MDKREVIYYTDELNDEFSIAQIEPRSIDENYVYIHTSLFKRFTHFFWYRVIATPIAFLYVKLTFGQKSKGRRKLWKHRRDGYFMYGNHTQDIGDAFIPNVSSFPKTDYIIVHANNVSMPVLGKITPSLGALPLPEGMQAYKNFLNAVETRIEEGHAVVIYPEAHIWPYYTKIRNFPDTSFAYPAKLGSPVYCFTNTYHKRKFRKQPKIVTYIDGPFYPDMDLPIKARKKELRDMVYRTMVKRAEKSDHVQIRYIKQENNQ
jgi:1-acyl-sn-glycerol-3-phosphate acyltransferase